MDTQFLSGFGLGALAVFFLQKILPILLKDFIARRKEKRKRVADGFDAAEDSAHKIMKAAALLYCSNYDRNKSLELRAEFNRFSTSLTQLNEDLHSIGESILTVDNFMIVEFRQKITNEIFSLRTDNYNFSDPLVNDIYKVGNILVEKLRRNSRALR